MSGHEHALYTVLTQPCAHQRADGRGIVTVLTSPQTGTGTSYVARQLALLAASHYGPQNHRVVLVDLDLTGQSQSAYFQSPAAQSVHGAVHGPYDATFGLTPFWQVSPDTVEKDGSRQSDGIHCCLHLVGETGLAFTQFQWSQIKPGQSVHIVSSPAYWQKIREHFAVVIVDTPAFDRTDTALTVIPEADTTVIINHENLADNSENRELAARIKSTNGKCAGMILNQGATGVDTAARPG